MEVNTEFHSIFYIAHSINLAKENIEHSLRLKYLREELSFAFFGYFEYICKVRSSEQSFGKRFQDIKSKKLDIKFQKILP